MNHYSDLAKQFESLPEGYKARWSFRFKSGESFYESLPQLLECCAEKIKQGEEEAWGNQAPSANHGLSGPWSCC